jgi:hypothetical protein
MMPEIKQVLHTLLDPSKDWRLYLLTQWNSIMGSLAARVRLERIEQAPEGTMLILGVYESVWLQELHMLSAVLIRSINAKLGQPYIKQVRLILVIKQKDRSKKYTDTLPILHQEKIVLTEQEKKALAAISNAELKQTLENFLLRCSQNS